MNPRCTAVGIHVVVDEGSWLASAGRGFSFARRRSNTVTDEGTRECPADVSPVA